MRTSKLNDLQRKVLGVVSPNKLIGRTVWSSPQAGMLGRKNCCNLCKYFVHNNPSAEYDPADDKSWRPFTSGKCGNLRVLAAYGDRTPHCKTYYYCNKFEPKKEKEDGS